MTDPGELAALRAEQQRIRRELDALEARLAVLEVRPPAAEPLPEPAISILAPPPLPVPSAAPPPTSSPAPAPARTDSLELRVGQVWLARIGILILLTGLVFLGNYAYHEFIGRLGAGGKLALLYLAAAALAALGRWLGSRHENQRALGRVLVAGGAATAYYATFAAHFVPTLRVIDSPTLAGALLLGLGAAFVVWAERARSQTLAAATIALSFYATAINAVATFSLFGNVVISIAAILLLARRRWTAVSFVSLLGCYGAYLFWRLQGGGSSPDLAPALLFPACYWLVHCAALFLPSASRPATRSAFFTINNAAFFALGGFAVGQLAPGSFWLFALAFGAVLLILAAVAARRDAAAGSVDGAFLAQGLALMALALLLKLTGWQLALSMALLALTLASLGSLRHGAIFRFFAGLVALLAVGIAAANVLADQVAALPVAAGVSLAVVGAGIVVHRQPPERGYDWRAVFFGLLALGLAGLVAVDRLPGHGLFPCFTAGSLALLALAAGQRRAEIVTLAVVLEAVAYLTWAVRLNFEPPFWPDLLGFIALLAATAVPGGRHRALLAATAALSTLGLWVLVHRLVAEASGGFLLTISWSAVAVLVLAVGFATRQRVVRVLGLVVLAAAVGRIAVVDVWELATFYRIVSFLVLGAVLLLLAFLYNRYADTLRRWL